MSGDPALELILVVASHWWHHAAAIMYFSQTFPAMLLRLVGTADTAGVCEKEP